MTERPDLRAIERRYRRARRLDRLPGRRQSLENDALLVVLEWGPAMRLSKAWRLEQRQPRESLSRREAALVQAEEVAHSAYELTAEAWPPNQREVPAEVNRVSKAAVETLAARYPNLDRRSLSRAVNQANYTHAK